MRTVRVKDLMVPIEAYATVQNTANLYQAILALEKAQIALDPSRHRHRAVLVLDESGELMGKLTMKDILIALEPNYRNLEGMGVLTRSGFSPDMIRSMLEEHALWLEPFQFICDRATQLTVNDFVKAPEESEYVAEAAPLSEAVHQLIMYPYISLLVTRDKRVVGILRLSDVFASVCAKIKTCNLPH